MDKNSKSSPIIRDLKRLFTFFGIEQASDQTKQDILPDKTILVKQYSQDELSVIPFVKKDAINKQEQAISFANALKALAAPNEAKYHTNLQTRDLTSEIDLAEHLIINSTISPSDMDTSVIPCVVDDTDLSPNAEKELSNIATEFYNEEIKLAKLTFTALKDALFGPGSAAYLVLPQENIRIGTKLVKASDEGIDYRSLTRGDESGLLQIPIFEDISVGNESANFKNSKVLTQFQELQTTAKIESLFDIDKDPRFQDILDSCASEVSDVLYAAFPKIGNEAATIAKDISTAVSKEIVKNKSSVKITYDPTVLDRANRGNDDAGTKLLKSVLPNIQTLGGNTVFWLSDKYQEGDNPAIIKIPAHAVVPVVTTNDPSNMIGAFILTDKWATPIGQSTGANHDHGTSATQLTENQFQAMFGPQSQNKKVTSNNNIAYNAKKKFTSLVFGKTIKMMLENKLQSYGYGSVSIGQHMTMTDCIFQHILDKEKIGMVFVPAHLLVYFAYDYNDDGTGKSMIDKIYNLAALRNNLTVAGVLGAMSNSIDTKTISVDMSNTDNPINVEQLLDTLNTAIHTKEHVAWTNDLNTINSQIVQRSTRFQLKGIQDVPAVLEYEKDHGSKNVVLPDDNLRQELSRAILQKLNIPLNAAEMMSDNSFATSIVTNHMFFRNANRNRQEATDAHLTKLIRLVALYSAPLQERFKEVIAKDLNITEDDDKIDAPKEGVEVKTKKGKKEKIAERTVNNDPVETNLQKVIMRLRTALPAANLVRDKAQFEQIEETAEMVEKVMDILEDEKLITNTPFADVFNRNKAILKRNIMLKVIKSSTFGSIFDIEGLGMVDDDEILDRFSLMLNRMNRESSFMETIVKPTQKAITVSAEESAPGGGGFNF